MDLKKISSGIGKGISVLDGITGILDNAAQSSRIADTSAYDNIISSIRSTGYQPYDSFEQLQEGQSRIASLQTDFDINKIRGLNDGQKVGNVLSSALTGASSGLALAGPWGALGGAIVGLGAGIGGVLAGDAKANTEQARLQNDMKLAQLSATRGMEASAENLLSYNHRNEISNASAFGGKIKRQLSITEFADAALHKKPVMSERTVYPTIIRTMCDGGIRMRIKR